MRDRIADVMWLIWRVWYPLIIYSLFGMGTAAVMQNAGFIPYERDAVISTGIAALMSSACLGVFYIQAKNAVPQTSCFHVRSGIWTVLAGIGSCFFVNNMITLIGLTSEAYEKASARLYQPSFGIQIAAIGFMIPVAEELIFRGLGYFRLRWKLSFWGAALISSLYFGWYHGNIVQGVYAFLLGLLLAGVYEAYHSLWAPVCLHVAANLSSLLFTELVPEEIRFRIPLVPMLLASGGVMMFGLYKIREDVKKREITINSNSLL